MTARATDEPAVFPLREVIQWLTRLAIVALSAWVWNAQGEIRELRAESHQHGVAITALTATTDVLQAQGTDIKLIQQELKYVNTALEEIKALVKERRR